MVGGFLILYPECLMEGGFVIGISGDDLDALDEYVVSKKSWNISRIWTEPPSRGAFWKRC